MDNKWRNRMQCLRNAIRAFLTVLLIAAIPAAAYASDSASSDRNAQQGGSGEVYIWSDGERGSFAVAVNGVEPGRKITATVWPQDRSDDARTYTCEYAGTVYLADICASDFSNLSGVYCVTVYVHGDDGSRVVIGSAKTIVRPDSGKVTVAAADSQQNAFSLTLTDVTLPDASVIVFVVSAEDSREQTVQRMAHRNGDGYTAQIRSCDLGRPGIYTAEACCIFPGQDERIPVGRGNINVAGLVSSRTSLALSESGVQGEFVIQARPRARSTIKSVAADVWYSGRPGDVRTYPLTRNGEDWTATGNLSSFDRVMGGYCARVYAVLENGIRAEAGIAAADLRPENYTWIEKDEKGATIHVENVAADASNVVLDVYSRCSGTDDLVNYAASRVSDTAWQARMEYRKHRDSGIFQCNVLVDGVQQGRALTYVTANEIKKHDPMRGVWIPAVFNLDFPRTLGDADTQMDEFRTIVRNCRDWGFNTLFVQVRPHADALYRSDINPWSDTLTGAWGRDPGYDPLAFMVRTAHDAGLELHAWLNPYRVCSSDDYERLDPQSAIIQHPDWIMHYKGGYYLDPANAGVRQHITDTVHEILAKYDVDGIHFDDYFYPYNYSLPEGESRDGAAANQMRENVTMLVRQVAQEVHSWPGDIQFGISPFGVWKNASSDPAGSDTNGMESYYSNYCDTVTWVKEGLLDYVCPQIYWHIDHDEASYSKLAAWWANVCKGTGTDLVIGHGVYKDEVAAEITQQLALNQQYSQITGSIFYRYGDIESKPQLSAAIKDWYAKNP